MEVKSKKLDGNRIELQVEFSIEEFKPYLEKAAKELSDYLDMKPKAKTQTESIEMDLSHQIEANFEKQTKKLTATKTKELGREEENNHLGQES